MKKFLLIAVMAVLGAVSTQAQVKLGGEVKVWYHTDAEVTSYALMPEIGYKFNNKWEAGAQIGFAGVGDDAFSFIFSPYGRYSIYKSGIFSFFGEGGFAVGAAKHRDTGFQIGLRPGVEVELGKHWCMEAHLGFLGFSANDDKVPGLVRSGVGFDFANGASFSLMYEF